jgi:hypothetical protein
MNEHLDGPADDRAALQKYAGALRNLHSEILASHTHRRGGMGFKVSVALRVAERVMARHPIEPDADD